MMTVYSDPSAPPKSFVDFTKMPSRVRANGVGNDGS